MTKELRVLAVLGLMAALLILTFKYIFPVVAPFFLGAIFACLIEPLVQWVERTLGISRRLAVILLLTALVLTVLMALGITAGLFYQEVRRLLPQLTVLVRSFSSWENSFFQGISKVFPQLDTYLPSRSFFWESFERLLRSLINEGMSLAPLVPEMLAAIGLGGVAAYFFSRDKEIILRFFERNLPTGCRIYVSVIKKEVTGGVAQFIRTEFFLVILTAFFSGIVFWGLGVSGALGYGLLAGLLDLIPVLGPGILYLAAVMVALIFGNYGLALGFGLGYFLLVALRQVVELKLLGENFNLHPLSAIIIIYVGIKVFGLAGVFLGPLLFVILRGYYRAAIFRN